MDYTEFITIHHKKRKITYIYIINGKKVLIKKKNAGD